MTQALYRRYRPQTFTEVIGQEHVTEPLAQALASGRVGHAYLFSGPRGCGKTTSARILARCLNCEQGPTPEPCGRCVSCVALATGGSGSVDVIEIDAASHGGVDDARDLREKASYGPAQSRYRVFIIDEAHMVTPQGFNALLKIVEEPPEHVKFIFATTEPEKVIGTIRSRTHHYPFRLVPPGRLHDYLEQVCRSEQTAVEQGVLSFVVRAGGGSVRDSLSVLDQLMAGSAGTITYASAAALLGFTEGELLDATVDAIAARDGAAVFRQIDKVIDTGHDPRRFVEDLLERFRDLIIVAAVGSNSDESLSAVLRGLPEDQIERLRQQAAAFGAGELSHAADVINTGLTAMTGATAPRLQLELLCARLLLPRAAGEDGVIARVDRLERRLQMGGPPPPSVPAGRGADTVAGRAPASPEPIPGEGPRVRGDEPFDRGVEPGRPAAGVGRVAAEQERRESRFGRTQPVPGGPAEPAVRGEPAAVEAEQTPAAAPERRPYPRGIDTDAIRRAWPDVLATIFTIRRATWTFLSQHSQVLDYDGERLLLGITSKGLARTFMQGPHAEVVRQALIDSRGVDCRVEGIALDDVPPPGHSVGRSATGSAPHSAAPGERPPAHPHTAVTHIPDRLGGQERGDRRAARRDGDSGHEPGRVSGQVPGQVSGRRAGAGERSPQGDVPESRSPNGRANAPGRAAEGGRSGESGRHETSPTPPDLPEPPDDEGPPEYDAPPDLHEAIPVADPAPPHPGPPSAARAEVWPASEPSPGAGSRSAGEAPSQSIPGAPATPSSQSPAGASVEAASAQQSRPTDAPPRRAGEQRTSPAGRRPASGHEAFRAAMAARRAQQRAADGGGATTDTGHGGGQNGRQAVGNGGVADAGVDVSAAGSGVSADDEDISDLSQVGTPVIAEVLGGVVIGETEE